MVGVGTSGSGAGGDVAFVAGNTRLLNVQLNAMREAAEGAVLAPGYLAMVVAGLMMGNQGRSFAMSEKTREHLDTFWELVDEILNAVLFLLIGLELLVLDLSGRAIAVGAILIVVVLAARFAATSIPVMLLKSRREFSPGVVRILTWGGLRGGISVALALGIPKEIEHREVILVATYVVVIFSIVVQGLTLKPLVVRVVKSADENGESPTSSA